MKLNYQKAYPNISKYMHVKKWERYSRPLLDIVEKNLKPQNKDKRPILVQLRAVYDGNGAFGYNPVEESRIISILGSIYRLYIGEIENPIDVPPILNHITRLNKRNIDVLLIQGHGSKTGVSLKIADIPSLILFSPTFVVDYIITHSIMSKIMPGDQWQLLYRTLFSLIGAAALFALVYTNISKQMFSLSKRRKDIWVDILNHMNKNGTIVFDSCEVGKGNHSLVEFIGDLSKRMRKQITVYGPRHEISNGLMRIDEEGNVVDVIYFVYNNIKNEMVRVETLKVSHQ